MSISAVYLGWEEPALASIQRFLKERYLARNELDLSACVLVFSGGRAGRRMLERLAVDAKSEGYILTPPRIITSGALPELYYRADAPLANEFEERLAWIKALKQFDPQKVRCIVGSAPDEDNLPAWSRIAGTFSDLYLELSGAELSLSRAGDLIAEMPEAPDVKRWRILSDIQREYLLELAASGLLDRQSARFEALKQEKLSFIESDDPPHLYLCAVRDLSKITKSFLDRVNSEVTALIFAPASESEGFDSFGCLVPGYWAKRKTEIAPEKIIAAADPADQALAAYREVHCLNGAYSHKEIVVGFTNQALLPYIEGAFKEAGLTIHDPGGIQLRRTKPVKLLECIGRFLKGRRMREFLELLRFPEVEDFVASTLERSAPPLLPAADDFQIKHLQSVAYRAPGKIRPSEEPVVRAASVLNELLSAFSAEKRPLDAWIAEIYKVLSSIYGETKEYREEFNAITESLNTIAQTKRDLLPFLSGERALSLILDILNLVTLPKDREALDIDALGWLELQCEDSPVQVICGMNEEFIPEAVNADSFLPEKVRKHLGLLDNERRFAREIFVLASLEASLKELRLIYSKFDSTGTPLLPSRLLVESASDVAARIEELYFRKPERIVLAPGGKVSNVKWEVPPAPRRPAKPLNSLPVTAFRRYIECPYRFYLETILKLEDKDDSASEMDGRLFGTLGHAVMAGFSREEAAKSSDASEISRVLFDILNAEFFSAFGSNPLPAVIIQKEQLKKRLALFAEWQAAWRDAGWEIWRSEWAPPVETSEFEVDGERFHIDGRIDRIDYNERLKAYAIFDYKFGEKTAEAEKSHCKGESWIDLQLPLYGVIFKNLKLQGEIKLGYLRLCPGIEGDRICSLAAWPEEKLDEARLLAFDIIKKIRKNEFWPPARRVFSLDRFSPIMGASQFIEERSHE